MNDLISRQEAIDALIGDPIEWEDETPLEAAVRIQSELDVEIIKTLPPAQPDCKPINYQDCANAMLKMWMDNVVTDGEYNRIMDKLNAFWRERNDE